MDGLEFSDFKFGRKPAKGGPALLLSSFLKTTAIPAHPSTDDYDKSISDWKVLGNDQYGDCVAVAAANIRHTVTVLAGSPSYWTQDEVFTFYKSQNPGFPSQDEGMEIQTALEYWQKTGGPDGVKAVAFAKVDTSNIDEVRAAAYFTKSLMYGISVTQANETEFDQGKPWDYVRGSQNLGGHGIAAGGYDPDIKFVTWGKETEFTDAFIQHQMDEAWVVIFPEHFSDPEFMAGIDVDALASAYQELTGKVLPVPVTPTPNPDPPTPTPTSNVESDFVKAYNAWSPGILSKLTKSGKMKAASKAVLDKYGWK